MAVVQRVRRLVNPRRRKRSVSAKRTRHRLTRAQIAAGFGGKRAQSGLKAARKRKRKATMRSMRTMRTNPRRRKRNASRRPRVVYRTRTKIKYRTRKSAAKVNPRRKRRRSNASGSKHRRARRNPYLVTWGPALMNPGRKRKRRKNPMAKSRKRRRARAVNPRRRRRRSNPRVRVVYRSRKRRNPRRHHMRRRNPFSTTGGAANMAKSVAAGLVGVYATKQASSMLSSVTSSNPLINVVVSGAAAWLGGFLLHKAFSDRTVGDAFMFGGFMQAGSIALNAWLPSVGSVIGLSGLRGLGTLTPSNDILLPYNMFMGKGAMVPAGSPGSMRSPGGGAGFAPAFA
jgi:hypothetical protein